MYSSFGCRFKITRGSTKDLKIVFREKDDVSGAERITLTVKENVAATDEEITIQKEYNETKSNLSTGIIVFSFLPEDTKNLDDGAYVFDIQITIDSETIYVPVVGEIEIYRNIWFRR